MTTKVRKTSESVSIMLNDMVDAGGEIQLRATPNSLKIGHLNGATTVKYGSVTVEIRPPRKADIKRNIRAGQLALARAKSKILNPGVNIRARKGVPLFHADPNRPGRLIRELDGKREQGMFVDGKFKTAK